MKQVLIRTDSGHHIGSGHLMRCLTLAGELTKAGAKVTFCCRHHSGHMSAFALQHYTVLTLAEPDQYSQEHGNYPHSHWLGCTEKWDAEQTLSVIELAGIAPDWVIVDHFALGEQWEQRIVGRTGAGMIVIDGLRDRPHDCRILIDPTLNNRAAVSGEGEVLSGPWYLPLRPEFEGLKPELRVQVKRLLVCFGGVDKDNITGRVCQVLAEDYIRQRLEKVHVVVGISYPHIESLEALCRKFPGYLLLEVQSSKMSQLMSQVDLAVGAGGSMSWERCAMALPTLCWTIADNQLEANQQLAKLSAIVHLGKVTKALEQDLSTVLASLLEQPGKLIQMSASAKQVMQDWTSQSRWITQLVK